MHKARIVVSGGGGFIGSHIVDALLARGNEILVLDDFSTGREANLADAHKKAEGRLSVEKIDISDANVVPIIAKFKPATVFHLAAQMNVRLSVAEPSFDARANVVGSVNILEGAKQAGAKQLIFSSTGGAIYGEQEAFPATEAHRCLPESPYGVSKLASELYLEYYARVFALNTVALRFANVYGPRQNPKGEAGVVAIFCKQLLQGETLTVNGDGKQTRDFVYVDDVVRANLLASENVTPATFQIFNVGTGIESSVLDIVESLSTISSEKSGKFSVKHNPAPAGEQRRSVISPAKISKTFGWTPGVDLRTGLAATLNSFS